MFSTNTFRRSIYTQITVLYYYFILHHINRKSFNRKYIHSTLFLCSFDIKLRSFFLIYKRNHLCLLSWHSCQSQCARIHTKFTHIKHSQSHTATHKKKTEISNSFFFNFDFGDIFKKNHNVTTTSLYRLWHKRYT